MSLSTRRRMTLPNRSDSGVFHVSPRAWGVDWPKLALLAGLLVLLLAVLLT